MIHFTVKEGLPSNEVHDLCIGPQGKIWMATDRGVSSYDGYRFKNYAVPEGLTDIVVFEIFRDPQDRLWFITYSGRLFIYEKGKITPYAYNAQVLSFKGRQIYPHADFRVDEEGTMSISFFNRGKMNIDRYGKISYEYQEMQDSSINRCYIEPGTDHSYFVSCEYSSSFLMDTNVRTYSLGLGNGKYLDLPDSEVMSVNYVNITRVDQLLYVSIGDQLFVVENGIIKDSLTLPSAIIRMRSIGSQIWLGLHPGGVRMIERHAPVSDKPVEIYLKDLSVTQLIEDGEGGVWISTVQDGIYYIPDRRAKHISTGSGLPFRDITTVTTADGQVYFGASDGSLGRLGVNGVEQFSFDIFSNNIIYGLEVRGNDLFVNSNARVIRLGVSKHQYPPFDLGGSVKSIYKDPSGNLLMGGNGLHLLDKNDQLHKLYMAKYYYLDCRAICYQSEGRYWVGSENGLFLISNDSLTDYSRQHALLKDRIWAVEKLSSTVLLAGTRNDGILLFDLKKDTVMRLCNKLYNCHLKVNNMKLIRGKDLWVATFDGLYKFAFEDSSGSRYDISHFAHFDGLSSNRVYDLDVLDDSLYLATDNGITVLSLDDIEGSPYPPKLIIEELTINQHIVATRKDYRLEHWQNQLGIAYKAIDFKSAGMILYRYRLKGLEEEWVNTRELFVRYAGLPPGDYTFQLQAIDKDGVSAISPLEIRFSIDKPFWLKWWFLLTMIAIVITLIVLIFIRRGTALRKDAQKKLQMAREKADLEMRALRAQMNPHFIFNTLNSIQYLINAGDNRAAEDYLVRFSHLLRNIIEKSPVSLITLEEELQILHTYVELERLRLEENFEYKLDIQPDMNPKTTRIPGFILQPFVENAILHGLLNKKGERIITICISRKEGIITCDIIDNGVGRKMAAELSARQQLRHKSVGLVNTRQRINLINGQWAKERVSVVVTDLFDKNGASAGTKVTLYIKINLDEHDSDNSHR